MTEEQGNSLDGKVAIVTGAARGLGRQYGLRLAQAGAAVVLGDRLDCADSMAAVAAAGGQGIAVEVDVADTASCQAMAAQAIDRFGRIDVLINNAALYGGLNTGPFERLDEAEWDACMAVNVKGIWNCCKAVVAPMREQDGGSIVNISSLAATYGLPNALHYTTSKAAVIGLTRGLARELGRHWIRVNAIAPSAVMTEGTAEFMGERLERAAEVIRNMQALRRNLDPDDLAGTVLYLASDASRFVTGQTIMVDGGTTFL
ncbi:MAG: glucose 1-dehydrogenase [Alphaproteobacteria bacterium]|jgi:3-oxoacyl-[acyl-carrier protein] reductase|nr:glucose 1-dehydrogenase [Alphaproteobacteria bacterium]|tara:strand:- start:85 stop:861 length:777 start_codon:yes stop_codon:yes gene_type:complete